MGEDSPIPIEQQRGGSECFLGLSVEIWKNDAQIWQSLSTEITDWLPTSVFGDLSSCCCRLAFIWEDPCERNMEILITAYVKKALLLAQMRSKVCVNLTLKDFYASLKLLSELCEQAEVPKTVRPWVVIR